MCTSGGTLIMLGKSYELRGNGADGSHWRDKPLYGWVTHLPAGWGFTPAPRTLYMPDGCFYAEPAVAQDATRSGAVYRPPVDSPTGICCYRDEFGLTLVSRSSVGRSALSVLATFFGGSPVRPAERFERRCRRGSY
jgi:hypothetical protein